MFLRKLKPFRSICQKLTFRKLRCLLFSSLLMAPLLLRCSKGVFLMLSHRKLWRLDWPVKTGWTQRKYFFSKFKVSFERKKGRICSGLTIYSFEFSIQSFFYFYFALLCWTFRGSRVGINKHVLLLQTWNNLFWHSAILY